MRHCQVKKSLGLQGISLTEHKPEGIVLLNGKNYDAYSTDGFLPKGKSIIVTGKEDFRLIIKEI
jgi:membrane-bound ClpP family serine protease